MSYEMAFIGSNICFVVSYIFARMCFDCNKNIYGSIFSAYAFASFILIVIGAFFLVSVKLDGYRLLAEYAGGLK